MPAPLKRIFITGAGGMLGSDLANALQGSFEVFGAGLTPPASHLTIPYLQIDLSNQEIASQHIGKFQPQIIFHTAAFTDVDAYQDRSEELLLQTALLTKSIVDAANQTGALLIFFSSDYVFDGKKKGEYLETDSPCPQSKYGESKAEAEAYIQKNASHYAIFRISWLYGLHGKSFPRAIWEKAETQQEYFKVVHDQTGRPTYTRDIAGAFKQILTQIPDPFERMTGQIFHLTNSGKATWAEVAEFILNLHPFKKGKVERISSAELNRPAQRPENSLLCLDKAAKILDVRLRDWKPAMVEFLQELAKKPSL